MVRLFYKPEKSFWHLIGEGIAEIGAAMFLVLQYFFIVVCWGTILIIGEKVGYEMTLTFELGKWLIILSLAGLILLGFGTAIKEFFESRGRD